MWMLHIYDLNELSFYTDQHILINMKTRMGRFLYFTAILLELALIEPRAYSAGWVKATVNPSGASLYRQPSPSAEVLGKYPAGAPLKVYSPPKNGYYAMYFAKEWKGTHYVWLSANEIAVQDSGSMGSSNSFSTNFGSKPRSNGSSSSGSGRIAKNKIRIGGNLYMFSPSDFQTGIGQAQSSITTFGFNLNYERRFGKFAVNASFQYYSMGANTTEAGGNYSVGGFLGMVGGSYYIYSKGALDISASALVGLSLYTAQETIPTNTIILDTNSNRVGQISTSNIMGVPIEATLNADYRFYNRAPQLLKNLSGFLKIGYRIESLGNIPAYSITTSKAVTPNISLSAPVVQAGLGLEF